MDTKNDKDLIRSHIASVAVCIPSFCLAVWLMESKVSWDHPSLLVMAVLGLALANFVAAVALDQLGKKGGALTAPALLASAGVALLYIISESINRFFMEIGYNWLLPCVIAVLLLCSSAIFRERMILIKVQLACNLVAVAVLWTLGVADKVAVPF